MQALKGVVIVTFLGIKLVNKEYYRLLEFLRIAEVVLCAHLGTHLTINQEHTGISNLECCKCCTYEVIRPRAVYNVKFLVIPLHMEDSRENGITILMFYREIVGDGILLSDTSTTIDDTSLIEQRFCEGGLTRAIIAKECNVLDFTGLINFHRFLCYRLVSVYDFSRLDAKLQKNEE